MGGLGVSYPQRVQGGALRGVWGGSPNGAQGQRPCKKKKKIKK